MNRIFNVLSKWPKTTIVLILLSTIPFGVAFTQKSFRNHVTLYFEADDPVVVAYEKFKTMYGNEEAAIIVVHADDIFTDTLLGIVRDISSMAKAAEGVQRVFSLTEATEAVGRGDTISFEPIVPREALDPAQLEAVRKRVLAKPFVIETLISKTGDTTAIVLELASIASAEDKGAILKQITAQAERIAGKHARLYFSGAPFVEYEINALTQRDDKVFTPIVIALVFFLAALFLKSISLAALCLVNVVLTLVWSVGIFVLTGHRFSMVTVVMPPMILAITVADAIHILSHFKTLYSHGKSRREAIFNAAANLWLPCLLTSLTTAVGFLSFLTTDIDPLRTLGLFTFIGVMLAYIMTIMILPAFMIVFIRHPGHTDAPRKRSGDRRPRRDAMGTIQDIGRLILRHYKSLAIAMPLIMAVAFVGALKIRYETNFANHLDETNPIKQGIRFIENKLFGTVPVALLVRAKSPANDFTHPESVKLIDALQADLKRDFPQKYSSFFSIGDYFKSMHQAFNQNQEAFYVIPENRMDILDYYELGETDILERILSADRMEARISFNAYLGPIAAGKQLAHYLDVFLAQGHGDRFACLITGSSALYAAMDQNLKECLYRSFSIAFLIIFGMMHLVCRNWKLTLISILPNLFPIVCTFGLMGYLNIPLDVSTIMIASITIGIAVDDTIHFLVWYRRNALSGMETEAALLKTFADTAKPILITSVILCVSFFCFMAGSVLPVRAFGVLTAMSIAFAFLGDILLLPTMIMIFRPDLRTDTIHPKRKWYPGAIGKLARAYDSVRSGLHL